MARKRASPAKEPWSEAKRVRGPEGQSVSFRPGVELYRHLKRRQRPGLSFVDIVKRDLLRYYSTAGVPASLTDEQAAMVGKAVRAYRPPVGQDALAVVQAAVATYRGIRAEQRTALLAAMAAWTVEDAAAMLAYCEMTPEVT